MRVRVLIFRRNYLIDIAEMFIPKNIWNPEFQARGAAGHSLFQTRKRWLTDWFTYQRIFQTTTLIDHLSGFIENCCTMCNS